MKNPIQVLKNFFKKLKVSGIAKDGVRAGSSSNIFDCSFNSDLASFLKSNLRSKQFIKNLLIWSVIIVTVMIVLFLIL